MFLVSEKGNPFTILKLNLRVFFAWKIYVRLVFLTILFKYKLEIEKIENFKTPFLYPWARVMSLILTNFGVKVLL